MVVFHINKVFFYVFMQLRSITLTSISLQKFGLLTVNAELRIINFKRSPYPFTKDVVLNKFKAFFNGLGSLQGFDNSA